MMFAVIIRCKICVNPLLFPSLAVHGVDAVVNFCVCKVWGICR